MELRLPYILLKGRYYPIIQVVLRKNNKIIKTEALVDSGAVISLFQGSIADALDIDLESGEKRLFQGIGGKIVGYVHKLMVNINELEFPCKIAFSNEIATSLNMLGREDFFDELLLTFDDRNKQLIIKILNE